MKIASQSIAAQSMALQARDGLRPAAQRGERAQGPGQPTSQPAAQTVAQVAEAAPGRPTEGPPGLQRVLARLEAMGEAGRTPGQSQALDRIGRNLARYLENQALAPLPPVQPAPEPDPAAGTPDDVTSEVPVDVPVEVPAEEAAQAPSEETGPVDTAEGAAPSPTLPVPEDEPLFGAAPDEAGDTAGETPATA